MQGKARQPPALKHMDPLLRRYGPVMLWRIVDDQSPTLFSITNGY